MTLFCRELELEGKSGAVGGVLPYRFFAGLGDKEGEAAFPTLFSQFQCLCRVRIRLPGASLRLALPGA